jgi:threonine/homoserine/homoserine lactone efflux protein
VVFLSAILLQVFVVTLVGAFVIDVATDEATEQPSTAEGWVMLALGALVLVLAVKNWQKRADATAPKVFDTIAGMGPGAVGFLAFGVALLNPKNLMMLLAGGARAGASGDETATVVIALVIFTCIATLPFTASVGYLVAGGEAAKQRLDRIRRWLMAKNTAVMAVMLGVLGLVIVGQGITTLAG